MNEFLISCEQNYLLGPMCNCIEKDKIANSYKRFPEDGLINLMIASAEMHVIIIDVGPGAPVKFLKGTRGGCDEKL